MTDVSHAPLIKRAMDAMENLWEDYMQKGKINPVSGIFLGKNHFGYTDKQEIAAAPKKPFGDAEGNEELAKRHWGEHTEA